MTQTNLSKVELAIVFGARAHIGQVRKYSGLPYIVHPIEVATICAELGGLAEDEDALCAAILHDVLEDTDVAKEEIGAMFGAAVLGLVEELTEVPVEGNRAFRKEAERIRLGEVSDTAQTIKVADLISNTRSIVKNDPDFAKVYLEEKTKLLPELCRAHIPLQICAYRQLKELKINVSDADQLALPL